MAPKPKKSPEAFVDPARRGHLDGFQLPPEMTVSQWADANIILPPETAAEPGRWRTARAPYQRGMMDAIADPTIKTIVLNLSAQSGKTSMILNGIGYHIAHAPAPMLMIQPTLEMAEAFSKDKLAPVLRDTPVLKQLVEPEKTRYSANTIRHKTFPGGQLTIAGANSPTSLRMRSVKIVWADEIDAYPQSVGEEGDPLKLAHKRTQTFWDSKLVCSSTPTLVDTSRIDHLYRSSDQRKFHIPCPDCGEMQELEWEHVTWTTGKPHTAVYVCLHCGTVWEDGDIKRQLKHGEWKSQAVFNGIAGFHIWQAYSPWSSLEEIVAEYEATEKKPAERQVWWNTTLARVWDGDEVAQTTPDQLYQRREDYDAYTMPSRSCVLTAGVDVQGDRLECLIVAHGIDGEQWLMAHLIISGDPTTDAPWQQLTEVLNVRMAHPSGRTFGIEAVAIDSGYLTQRVYDYCARNFAAGRSWFAVKGMQGPGKVAWTRSTKKLKIGARLFLVGVDGLKEQIYSRLANAEPGPGYIHIPNREPFNIDWLTQLTVERVRTIYDHRGFAKREWFKPEGARNEAIDCLTYADAAHASLNINHRSRLEGMSAPQNVKTDAADLARMFL